MNIEDTVYGFDRENFEKGYDLFRKHVVPFLVVGTKKPFRSFWNVWSEGLSGEQKKEVLHTLAVAEINLLGLPDEPIADSVPELLDQLDELTEKMTLPLRETMRDSRFQESYMHEDAPEFRVIWDMLPEEHKKMEPDVQSLVAGATAAICEAMIRIASEEEAKECEEDIKLARQLFLIASAIAIVCIVVYAAFFFDYLCPATVAFNAFMDAHSVIEGTVLLVSLFGGWLALGADWELGRYMWEEHKLKKTAEERTLQFA